MSGTTLGPEEAYRFARGEEVTSTTGLKTKLRRPLDFRDDADRARQVLPFSAYDSENPEDLWEYMGMYEQKTGGRMLAIPHNGNLSNGTMFQLSKFDGSPLDRVWVETRIQREPLAPHIFSGRYFKGIQPCSCRH